LYKPVDAERFYAALVDASVLDASAVIKNRDCRQSLAAANDSAAPP